MMKHGECGRRDVLIGAMAFTAVGSPVAVRAATTDASSAPQPFFASVERAVTALAMIGEPITAADRERLAFLMRRQDAADVAVAEQVLGRYVIANVTVQPDGYALTTMGSAPRLLVEQGWRAFLVRVVNPTGAASTLKVTGATRSVVSPATGASRAVLDDTLNPAPSVQDRWYRNELHQAPPIGSFLSGNAVEYQVLKIYSRDRGRREMQLDFTTTEIEDFEYSVQHRSPPYERSAHFIFQCLPAHDIALAIRDTDGRGCTASLVIKDGLGRIYPFQAMRLAPDMFFHPQVYRADGETVTLPDGDYVVEARRGPEYLVERQSLRVAGGGALRVDLKRWIDPTRWGWYSGDTHIHGSGCAHYESPTEGVTPETIVRHVRGEGLAIADVLSWGPGWYYQKQFFSGHAISPPAALEHPALQQANNAHLVAKPTKTDAETALRYDVEVSGFPSSHSGHLVLLDLKAQDYPGTARIEDWPSWNLPVLQWAKAQGAFVGYAHCGLGMQVASTDLPNYEIPPMDGIGTQEAIIDVTHGCVDFLSGTNTIPSAELNAWYHMLNCGFRLAMVGETDYPCVSGERPGKGRSYVHLDERPTGDAGYEAWISGLRAGRFYFGNGKSHFLRWDVDGLGCGAGDLRLPHAKTVAITALVAARLEEVPYSEQVTPPADWDHRWVWGWDIEKARIGKSRDVAVELIVNGEAVERQVLHADGVPRALTFSTQIAQSSWVALRILPSAHTHPVFVEVAGRPIRASQRSARWCRSCVDKLWKVKSPLIRASERAAAAQAYDVARRAYDRIAADSMRP